MKKFLLLALLVFPVAAWADGATETHGTTKAGLPYFQASEVVTGQGKVIAIDKKLRDVSILGAEGDTVIVTCGPEVKNFAQIVVGDVVKVKYKEILTIHVEEGGAPHAEAGTTEKTAEMGHKPAASAHDKLQFSGSITAINKEKGTVTLKGVQGDEYELSPRVKSNLDKVKVGQLVVFTYEQIVAASIQKAGSTKSASKSSSTKSASSKGATTK